MGSERPDQPDTPEQPDSAPDEGAELRLGVALNQIIRDEQAGALQALGHYLARYRIEHPGCVAELQQEYRKLVTGVGDGADDLPKRFGPFEWTDKIGKGGQAQVLKAVRDGLDRTFALKVLNGGSASEAARRRFLDEAKTVSKLDHAGLCSVSDHGTEDQWLWFAMDYVRGESFADRLARARQNDGGKHREGGSRVAVDEVLGLLEQVAEALEHAHARGVVHRDVKPANIMIREDDQQAVLVDFGIARERDRQSVGLTAHDEILGTPFYLSPEQIGGVEPDARTDVYSLGVTLYEALAGRPPYRGPADALIHQEILQASPPDLRRLRPEVSRDLAVVVATAMNGAREQRYSSAAMLAGELRRVRLGEPIRARRPSAARKVWMWSRRNRGWATTIAAAASLLVTVAVVAVLAAVRADRMRQRSDQLAGKPAFEALIAQAKSELVAPVPARIPRFEKWLERARRMLAEAPERRSDLDRIRRQAEPQSDLDRERDGEIYALEYANLAELRHEMAAGALSEKRGAYRQRILDRVATRYTYTFADYDLQIRHDALRDYVLQLDRLAEPDVVNTNTVAALQHRMELARSFAARLGGQDVDAWAWAQSYLQSQPLYAGVVMEPIPGLVPLGYDRTSGLLELWHMASGERPEWTGERLGPGHVTLGDAGVEGLVLVLLPGATFRMGVHRSLNGEGQLIANNYGLGLADERPVHEVTLDAFLMSKFEVHCAQYERCVEVKRVSVGERLRAREPQGSVSWDDAERVCRMWDLALPTEAQWEYACRAGTSSPFSCGWHWKKLRGHANYGGKTQRRDGYDDGYRLAAPVGSFAANPFGLFDMHGNISEWCLDSGQPYGDWVAAPGSGLRGIRVGMALRAHRGGSYEQDPWDLRSGKRARLRPTATQPALGFRPSRGLRAVR
ncbi:MAG: SUMF1/EgtB/PvdO family nonheme iron enzyme [Planctomycetota bacterium]